MDRIKEIQLQLLETKLESLTGKRIVYENTIQITAIRKILGELSQETYSYVFYDPLKKTLYAIGDDKVVAVADQDIPVWLKALKTIWTSDEESAEAQMADEQLEKIERIIPL